MRWVRTRWVAGLSLVLVSLVTVGAFQGQGDPVQPQYLPTVAIRDLMIAMIDPSADVVWEAVSTTDTATGVEERAPSTDEEWLEVRRGAIQLLEAGNLLLMPGRPVARPGAKSFAPGVELEPEEIGVLIAKDRASWNAYARALHAAGTRALEAIDERDAPKLFAVGELIEHACEGCHSAFWYPNQPLPPDFYPPDR